MIIIISLQVFNYPSSFILRNKIRGGFPVASPGMVVWIVQFVVDKNYRKYGYTRSNTKINLFDAVIGYFLIIGMAPSLAFVI